MERCAATNPMLLGCSDIVLSMSAEDCAAHHDFRSSQRMALPGGSAYLVGAKEIIDKG
jgi:hypothetical protein